MSRTTVLAVYPGEKTETLLELHNSYGSGPVVWEAMAGKYLGVTKSYSYPDKGWMQLDNVLWDLWKRNDIPQEHRLVFMLTFDRAYVAKKNFPRMCMAIDKFLTDFPPKAGHVNHWRAIMGAFFTNERGEIPGIGLHCTSVMENPFDGRWNEEKEEYDQPDWTQIYELCELLDAAHTSVANGDSAQSNHEQDSGCPKKI